MGIELLWTLIVGFIVGLISRYLMPGKQVMGIFMTTLFGCGGAVLASYAGKYLGFYKADDQVLWFASAVVGALVLLFIYGKIIGK